ncbi:MAG: hypothetical protein JWN45_2625 [Acidobacteriaceae bacterium]|nr:hypothetical protein [Acidobacteriaceae bacterium]
MISVNIEIPALFFQKPEKQGQGTRDLIAVQSGAQVFVQQLVKQILSGLSPY